MFSNLNKPAFGTATTGTTSFGFGTAAAPSNPFGQSQLFGAKPSGTTFGASGSTFGQAPGTSLFPGSQPQTGGIFQSSTPAFGATATGQTGFGSNIFGSTSQQPTGGGLFGSNAFGQQNKPTGFGFGATASQSSLFAQAQPTAQQTASPFQPSTSNTLFGGGAGFGATQQTGTVIKFQPLTSTDTMQKSGVATTINTKHHCITCMKEYEGKSLEELRWEDYQANRKGPQQPGFGATSFTSTTGGFGSAFGLGTQTANTSQNIFGKPAGFGSTTTTTSSFGFGTNTMTASPFQKPFGATTAQPLFGATAPQAPAFGSGGMFSQPQQVAPLFGKQQTTTPFGGAAPSFTFAAQPAAPQQSSLFQVPKTNTAFSGFGQANQTTASVFGQSQPAFGQSNQTAFSSSFAKPAAPTFGQTSQPTFGTGVGMQQQGSLFSNLSKPGGNLFAPSAGNTGFFGTSTVQPQTSLIMPQQQQQSLQMLGERPPDDYKIALNMSDQFGQMIELANLKQEDDKKKLSLSRTTNPEDIQKLLVSDYSPVSQNPMRSNVLLTTHRKASIFDSLAEEMSVNNVITAATSRKRLVLKKKHTEPLPFFEADQEIGKTGPVLQEVEKKATSTPIVQSKTNKSVETKTRDKITEVLKSQESASNTSPEKTSDSDKFKNSYNFIVAELEIDRQDNPAVDSSVTRKSSKTVILERPEYYTLPPLEDLDKLTDEEGKCFVQGFTVGRVGYGNVYFPDKMDVSGLNLDEIVHIRYREIVVYPDDTNKPPLGQGLNRPAQVTFDRVFPVVKGVTVTQPDKELVAVFAENLRQVCEKKEMTFVEYRPDTGSFVFKVAHFTRYALDSGEVLVKEGLRKPDGSGDAPDERTITDEQKSMEKIEERKREKIISSAGLGGVIVPDIEMADVAASEDIDTLNFNVPMDDPLTSFSINAYETTLSNVYDEVVSRTELVNKVKELQLMKSAFYSTPKERTSSRSQKMINLVETRSERSSYKVKVFYDIPHLPSRNLMDMALFKGKSAKIGWSKGSAFYKPLWDFDNASYFALMDEFSTPNKLQVVATETSSFFEFITASLEHFQEQCDYVMADDGVPLFRLMYPHKFVKQQVVYASKMARPEEKDTLYIRNVWGFCWALFGPQRNSDSNRLLHFNRWLEVAVSSTIDDTVAKGTIQEIYLNLTGRRIHKAASLALKNRYARLSLLISTFTTINTKQSLTTQISEWKKSGAIKHINSKLIQIYLLLAGMPICGETNICSDLEWLRAFAVHVWYVALSSDPLGVSVELYERAFKELGYAAAPYPSYYEGDPEKAPYDLIYHLILLFTKKNVMLNSILNPATYTSNANDYMLSWFLLQVFTALKVGTISDNARTYICTSFSAQLEQLDLWQYSIFVLLFIKNTILKTKLIIDVLHRNLPENFLNPEHKEMRLYLIQTLHLPPSWIHSVLADKCRFSGDHCGEFHNLMSSDQVCEAQTVALKHIVPKLVINKRFALAQGFLQKLEERRQHIVDFRYKTGLLLGVLRLLDTMRANENANDTELMHYREKLMYFCKRMKYFEVTTAEQSLCMAELSKYCASFLFLVHNKLKPHLSNEASYLQAVCIDELPMPPDYKAEDFERFVLEFLDSLL